ncbi:MAG: hypothetical protein C0482_01060 [Gordonia sp.]|uniref:Ester cyclase n=1 Tax=Gordonia rubripertincta TaxID=36822 RepID=A0ABT4MYI2_GORRU|nr:MULTISPECIES: ester cyclase [Mycobacteriales]MBA4020928.1 hypothetical protein [Gordonia sp. (in: high G+C Gram-positive bacteria)]MCZ4550762.1 ester cyclase [Gordonia rubripertincta]OZG27158.1 hypothetical protein BH683_019710 [Williamsia sp. 1138]
MSNTRSVIEQHISAFNSRDTESDPWSVDAEMIAPAGTFSGREGVLGFLGVFQAAFSDGALTVSDWVVDGDRAAVEGVFAGTHDGVLQSPNGEVPPTGKSISFRWSASYQVRGDALLYEHLYFDQLDFLGQLGLLPA